MALLASRTRACVFWSRLLPRSSVVPQKTQERNSAVQSVQFPEFSLFFEFEKIRAASRFNRLKYQTTRAVAVSVPATYLAEQLGYITPDFFGTFAFFGAALTIFLHSVGMLFNNTIGYIYLKNDEETVKISYSDYWGKRVNVDVTIDQICPFNDLPTFLFSNPWYQRVRLADSKKTLKLYLSAGTVLDGKMFTGIFGRVY